MKPQLWEKVVKAAELLLLIMFVVGGIHAGRAFGEIYKFDRMWPNNITHYFFSPSTRGPARLQAPLRDLRPARHITCGPMG
jgi:hypothetical protein